METILIVDDNEDLQFNLSNIIQSEGYNVITAGEGNRAIKEVSSKSPNLVLLDMRLPGKDGMTILKEIKEIDSNIIVIMLTAYGDVKGAVNAMKLGAYDFITKPFDNDELVFCIKKALQTQELSNEVKSLRKQLNDKTLKDEVIGHGKEFKVVLKQVELIAPTNMTVMIQGESGTGKEIVCNLIHKLSLRKDQPLVAIDCGAIPDTLVESELFGHEKGSFTGADYTKQGKFEQANGGTLFLDELTNLTEANQMKLLRVIQERNIHRIGGKKSIPIDVRIICASNIQLADAVTKGKFRNDLFYRLNEFHINLPLLKDRRDDVPVLARHFLDEANKELSKEVKNFSHESAKLILEYEWPGNVRELKNVVRRAVLLTEGEMIQPESLSLNQIKYNENETEPDVEDPNSLEDATKKVERNMIIKALEQSGGNKIKAASLLSMNRKTLYRKIKSLGI